VGEYKCMNFAMETASEYKYQIAMETASKYKYQIATETAKQNTSKQVCTRETVL